MHTFVSFTDKSQNKVPTIIALLRFLRTRYSLSESSAFPDNMFKEHYIGPSLAVEMRGGELQSYHYSSFFG